MKNELRAIVLCRVSTEEQGESGLGLAAQKAQLEAFVAKEGIEVIRWETAVHGSASDEHYALLRRLLKDAKTAHAVLCVAKVDRYGRSSKAFALLEESGVRLVVAELGLAAGQLVIDMLAAMAKEERRMISARTRAALAALKAQGVKLGSAALSPEAARERASIAGRAARESSARFAADNEAALRVALSGGASYRAAAQALNEAGVKAPSGGTWHAMQVQRYAHKLQLRSGAV